jgi:uncharacterized protein YvpB
MLTNVTGTGVCRLGSAGSVREKTRDGSTDRMLKVIRNVPYIDQTDRWPTGCESVSAGMLLKYLGLPVSVDDFIMNYLPQQEFSEENGIMTGADPYKTFAGSPYDEDAYGCYAPVIAAALGSVFYDLKAPYTAVDETETHLDRLCMDYIDSDMPVILWASIDMKPTRIGPEWKLADSGEDFTWLSNEHCLLMTGYSDSLFYFNDPWHNRGRISYPRDLVFERHREMLGMAVGIRRQ